MQLNLTLQAEALQAEAGAPLVDITRRYRLDIPEPHPPFDQRGPTSRRAAFWHGGGGCGVRGHERTGGAVLQRRYDIQGVDVSRCFALVLSLRSRCLILLSFLLLLYALRQSECTV